MVYVKCLVDIHLAKMAKSVTMSCLTLAKFVMIACQNQPNLGHCHELTLAQS